VLAVAAHATAFADSIFVAGRLFGERHIGLGFRRDGLFAAAATLAA
jgi:hypothetical protein